MVSSLFHLFLLLGSEWILWILLGCSLLGVAVFIDRWTQLRAQERVGQALWEEQAQGWVQDGLPSAWREGSGPLAKRYPCMESRLLILLSKKPLTTSPEALERVTQSFMTAERMRLERGLAILGTLGNSAPFIGLFGTVLGIIKAFSELDKAVGSSGLASISGGLAEALVTTAAGLLVAIPSAITYNFYQRKIKAITSRSASLASLIISSAQGEE